MHKYEKLVHSFSEIVDDGRLVGNLDGFTLYAEADLVPIWREVAPRIPVSQNSPYTRVLNSETTSSFWVPPPPASD